MATTISISPAEARRLFIHRQGLARNNHFGRGINAVYSVIEQLGYVQIDTISVVERAHHHILGERVPNYKPDQLHELQHQKRKIFEYWSHAAAYLPMKDYRYYRPMMEGFKKTRDGEPGLRKQILSRIKSEGPVQSRDFEFKRETKSDGWWDWKPAKRELETLFLSGGLMVSHREGFQKVYDLPENILPPDTDVSFPTEVEWAKYLLLSMVDALGAASLPELSYSRSTIVKFTKKHFVPDYKVAIQELLESNDLVQVSAGKDFIYSRPTFLDAIPSRLSRQKVRFLSPFDNLIINRKRTLELFGFDYQIECYVPQHKRKFGYFCLPILWGDQFIGRLDAKADRKQQTLVVNLLQLEKHVKADESISKLLLKSIREFAHRQGCHKVDLLRVEAESELRKLFRSG